MTEYTPTLDEIAAATSKRTGVPMSLIKGNSRKSPIVSARHVVLALAREYGYNHNEIWGFIRRDATSYYNSVHRVKITPTLSKISDQVSNDLWTFDPREAA